MNPYTVCFDPDEKVGKYQWYPYSYYDFVHRSHWLTMRLRDRAAELMQEFKDLAGDEIRHISGVLADYLEDHPELVECRDTNALPGLIQFLRKCFETGNVWHNPNHNRQGSPL